MTSFNKILVAVDRTSGSQTVFIKALELAQCFGSKLVLFSAISPDYNISYFSPSIYPVGESIPISDAAVKIYMEHQEQERQHSLEFLNGLAAKATAAHIAVEIDLKLGDPARLICDVADSLSVDLIVVGRRGFSGLTELWMSSVSNYVLHHAPCSVLVVQPAKSSV